MTVGVLYILQHLSSKRSLAEGCEPLLQLGEVRAVRQAGESFPEAREVTEREIVDDADEAVELEKRVLQGRRREKKLGKRRDRLLDRQGDLARRLVDIAKAVRFIDDDEVPCRLLHVRLLRTRKLVGADDDGRLLKWIQVPASNRFIETLRFENDRGKVELLVEFLTPLLAQVGGYDDKQVPLSLGPFLRNEQPCLDRLPKPNLICEDCALRERTAKREERCFDLVWVQVDLRVRENGRQLLDTVRRAAAGQFESEVFGMIVGQLHRVSSILTARCWFLRSHHSPSNHVLILSAINFRRSSRNSSYSGTTPSSSVTGRQLARRFSRISSRSVIPPYFFFPPLHCSARSAKYFSGDLSPIAMLISLWAMTKFAIWLYLLREKPCFLR